MIKINLYAYNTDKITKAYPRSAKISMVAYEKGDTSMNSELSIKMPTIRTISNAYKMIKEIDPDCALKPFHLRKLCREGAPFSFMHEGKYYIIMEKLFEYFSQIAA